MPDGSPRKEGRPELRRLDLPRRNAVSFSIIGDVEVDEAVEPLLADLKDPDDTYASVIFYSKSSRRHKVSGAIWRSRSDDRRLAFSVRYEASDELPPSQQPPQWMLRASAFYERLRLLSGPQEFLCTAEFVFPEKDPSDLWFPLPTRLSRAPDRSLTYYVYGIEGARPSSSELSTLEYDFDLRWHSNGGVEANVRFSITREIDERLPEELLAIAAAYAKELIGS